jgi:hypothetical protein
MIDDLKKVYDEWNNKRLILESSGDFIEITTPFVDMHHDFIQLYFIKEADNQFKITDDGYILNEVDMLGIDIKNSHKRSEFFKTCLNMFGVNYNEKNDELLVTFNNINEYPEKQHRLIQCMLRISDMILTSRDSVISIFTEEISDFFKENGVLFIDGLNFTGTSGKPQNFDFALPGTKNQNEKLIKAINNPVADNYRYPLFSWLDVKDTRKKSNFIVLANDINKPITEGFIDPYRNYSIEVLEWSKRNEWIQKLKTG